MDEHHTASNTPDEVRVRDAANDRQQQKFERFGRVVYWTVFSALIAGLIAFAALGLRESHDKASPLPGTELLGTYWGLYALAVVFVVWMWAKRPRG